MYIKQAYSVLHEPWRYVLGLIVMFIGIQIGGIPLLAAVTVKHLANGGNIEELTDQAVMLNVLDSNTTFFYMLLSFAVGLLFLIVWAKYVHKQSFTSLTTSRAKIDWKRMLFAFSLVIVITGALTYIDYASNPENYELQFNMELFVVLALIAIIMIPLQAAMEEYLFRGYIMQGLGVLVKNRWIPLIVTSVIFGGLHYFNPEREKLGDIVMIYYIGTGFFLGIITLMDRGMELAIGFHAGNNLIAALLVTADWTVFKTNSVLKDISEPEVGWSVVVPVLVMYPIYIGIMAYKYKWKDWKDRLFGKVEPPVVSSQEVLDIN